MLSCNPSSENMCSGKPRLPFCKRFAKYKLACGVLRHKVQNTFGTDVVSLSGYAHEPLLCMPRAA